MLLLCAAQHASEAFTLMAPRCALEQLCTTTTSLLNSSPFESSARGLLFQDLKQAQTRGAELERELLDPNMCPMVVPDPYGKKKKGKAKGGGGGFGGAKTKKAPSKSDRVTQLRLDTLKEEGVCYVPRVMSKSTSADMLNCVSDELARAYKSVEDDPEVSVSRFNVPSDTFDPLRGYLLLPLRDEASVEKGEHEGATVRALRECLGSGTALGDLFGSELCGGGEAEVRAAENAKNESFL